jgi:NADH-quinone oxidoreductase subunit I
MNSIYIYIKDIVDALRSLWAGMRITGKYFISPGQIVTEQYPENRATLKMTDRFKGEIIMPHDENNLHKCTGCGICDMNCPNGSITVLTERIPNEEGKVERVLTQHIYRLDMCTLCGICVKTCPSDALDYGKHFEHAVYDKSKLVKTLNQPGSRLKKEKKV